MSKEQKRFKLSRNHIYCLLLWVLVIIQGSAQLLAVAIPNHDNSSVDLVNVWIRLGLYPSKNWFGFTTVTVLVGVGIYLYKHLMGEKLTLQRAMPFVKPLLINILLFLEVWDLDEWAAKWTYINENAVLFIVGTLIAVALSAIAFAVIINRELNTEFEKKVIPTLDEPDEKQQNRESRFHPQYELEYMAKHPIAYRRRISQLQKNREKSIKNEMRLQQHAFRKEQNEQAIRIAEAQLSTIRQINENKQQERLNKAISEEDEDEIKKILEEIHNLDTIENPWESIKNKLSISIERIANIGLLSTVLTLINFFKLQAKHQDNTLYGERNHACLQRIFYNQVIHTLHCCQERNNR